MIDDLIDRLAKQRGLGDAYHNYRGELMVIGRDTKKAILAAMGCPVDDAAAIDSAIDHHELDRWQALLPPVTVVTPSHCAVTLAIPADALERRITWRLISNTATTRDGMHSPATSSSSSAQTCAGTPRLDGGSTCPGPAAGLSHAAHRTGRQCARRVRADRGAAGCFEPRLLKEGRRLWGVAVQLYTLRSATTGASAISRTSKRSSCVPAPSGASFVGLNPLHALFPRTRGTSVPYSASSRHFLNVLYIAVERVPEFESSAEAQATVNAREFQAELARLRSTPCVDYPGVAQAKLRVLKLLHAQFRHDAAMHPTARSRQFHAYRAERGESLRRHALHDAIDGHMRAIDSHRYWGWPMWPEELREPTHAGVAAFEKTACGDRRFPRLAAVAGRRPTRRGAGARSQARHGDRPLRRLRGGRESERGQRRGRTRRCIAKAPVSARRPTRLHSRARTGAFRRRIRTCW
jgi:(1->4)-alpha-D-glucan 1-alpha-D-glucosylmutase